MLELPTQGSLNAGEPLFFVAVPDGSHTAYVGREQRGDSVDYVTYSSVDTSKAQLVALTPATQSISGQYLTALAADNDTVYYTSKDNKTAPTHLVILTETLGGAFLPGGSGDNAGIALWGEYVYVASTIVTVSRRDPTFLYWGVEVRCTAIDIAVLAEDGILGVACTDTTVIFNIAANATHPEEMHRWSSGTQTNVAVAAMDGIFVVASVGAQTEVAVFSPSEDPPLRNTFVLPPASCDQLNGIAVAEINRNKTVFLSCSTTGNSGTVHRACECLSC
ncbi:hypothetical protein DIPPA_00723 [Diplonema papillatum]|nr:hypothetical protein DIPPA_00723 [Diplonema papillatum]